MRLPDDGSHTLKSVQCVCACVCLFDNVPLSQTFRMLLLRAFCLIKERTVYILRYLTATLLCVCLKALICVSGPGDEFSHCWRPTAVQTSWIAFVWMHGY